MAAFGGARAPFGLLIALVLLAAPGLCAAGGPFADWAAVVVAGDFHASHSDAPTEAFDDARRDVAAELVRKGFSPQNVLQFSVRPQLYPTIRPGKSDFQPILDGLKDVAQRARSGCLVYFSSHGGPQGVQLGEQILPPDLLDQMVTEACGRRPTIVIISACFSGVFVPIMADTNRMILTAARPDRTSFGCGISDKYPYFDACMLQELPQAHDFADLGPKVQACVAQRELDTGASPPSEPQLWIGPALRPILPLMAFAPG
jgi:hypothetical protein